MADLLAPATGLVFLDQAGIEIGVDGHLLAGHPIQREAGGYFGDPRSALGDHDELDDEDDQEDDDADGQRTARHEVAEGFDNMASRGGSFLGIGENQAGRGGIEHQSKEGQAQQQRGGRPRSPVAV